MDLKSVRELIAQGKKQKADAEILLLEAEIGERQGRVDLNNAKTRSAEVSIEATGKEKSVLIQDAADLDGVRNELSTEQYQGAKDFILAEINEKDRRLHELRDLIREMQHEIATDIASLAQLRDKCSALRDPDYHPKYAQNMAINTIKSSCRHVEVVDIFDKAMSLETRVKSLEPDIKAINLTIKLEAGLARKTQESLNGKVNDAEQILFTRAFGLMTFVGNKYQCGQISALKRHHVEPSWDSYISEARGQLTAHVNSRSVPPPRKESVPEVKNDTEEESLRQILLDANLPVRLGQALNMKENSVKAAVWGGVGTNTRNTRLASSLVECLGLKRLVWYDCAADDNRSGGYSLLSSMRTGGVHLLIIFTQWIGHAQIGAVKAAAESNNVKIVYANSSSLREVITVVAAGCEIPLCLEAVA